MAIPCRAHEKLNLLTRMPGRYGKDDTAVFHDSKVLWSGLRSLRGGSILCRRCAGEAFEHLREMSLTAKARVQSNLGKR